MNTGTIILLRGKFFRMFVTLILICVTQSFAQVNWTKYENNPVLTQGSPGEWDDEGFAGMCVIYEGSLYKMWYGGSDGTNFRIGYATSPDGISWTKYDDPLTTDPPYAESDPVLGLGPGSFESVWVYFPTVYFDGSTYHMWYSGTNGNVDRIGYATSPDGINWTKDTVDNPVISAGSSGTWDDVSVDPGPVRFNGTEYEMIYNGYDGLLYQGGYATSPDGISWTKSQNPVLPAGSSSSWDYPRANPSSVVYNSNTSKYYIFYSGGEFLNWRIGCATADNFAGPWTKLPSIVVDATPGSWDADATAFPAVIFDPGENLYKMWYVGGTVVPPGGAAIGLATSWVLDTLYVPNDYPTIQEAINAANNGGVVLVDDGTYVENINFRGKAITVASRFIVDGDESHIENTIIDGSQPANPDSGSAVYFVSGEDTTSVLCGFTITGGTGTYTASFDDVSGGGIFIYPSGAKICNNIIEDNTVSYNSNSFGGGIIADVENRSIIIEDNIIQFNTTNGSNSTSGGAIAIFSDGYVRISNNKIINNIVNGQLDGQGGGITCNGSSAEFFIKGNFINGNICYSSENGGGGICLINCSADLRNNLIVNNSAYHGGGILLTSTSKSKLHGRYRTNNDEKVQSNAFYVNNTLANNSALDSGGGIDIVGQTQPIQLINFILWGNTAPTDSQISGNADVQYSDVEGGYAGTGNGDWEPLFRDTANNDFHIMSITDCGDSFNSSCIDAGNPDYVDVIHDCLHGLGDMRSDMGAYGGADLIIGVDDQERTIPTEYSLYQNYPNPFNPNTKIKFSIPQTSQVQIKVFDVLGNALATLVSEEKPAGTYQVTWNAANLPSGVYFYRLQAGSFAVVKKMLLLK